MCTIAKRLVSHVHPLRTEIASPLRFQILHLLVRQSTTSTALAAESVSCVQQPRRVLITVGHGEFLALWDEFRTDVHHEALDGRIVVIRDHVRRAARMVES